MTLRDKVILRRYAIKCMVKYGEKLTIQDIAYAVNRSVRNIRDDVNALSNVWQQDSYLYYGERL